MSQQIPQPSAIPGNTEIVVLLPPINDLAKFEVEGPANVESLSRTVDYDMTTLSGTQFSDSQGFPDNEYNRETKTLNALSELAEAGQTFVCVLYPYRSTARALVPPVKQPGESDDDFRAKMLEYHQIAFQVLYPECDKIKKVMEYCFTCITTIRQHFQHIVTVEQEKGVQSHPLLDLLIGVFNNLILLNALKNNKASLTNDFSSYKRSFNSVCASLDDIQADSIRTDIHQLQLFLGNPRHPRDYILYILRTAIQSVENFELGLSALFEHIKECIENSRWLLPENELVCLRIIPFLYYLMDTDMKDAKIRETLPRDPADKTPNFPKSPKKDVNAFKAKTIDHSFFKKIVKSRPILPLYGDMHINVLLILQSCPHWEDESMKDDWHVSNPKELEKISRSYLLTSSHEAIRGEYNRFMADFASLLSETRSYRESKKAITPQILQHVLDQVLSGLRMVSRWSGLVMYQCAWKFANPLTDEVYKERKKASGPAADAPQGDPSEFEKAVRFNYTDRELHVLIDILGMIKGVGSVMLENELTITPLLNRAVHDNCQIFLQTEVARPLRKAYKNDRKDVLHLLLQIREIGGDWYDYAKQKDDYLLVKKELIQVNRDFPRRPTAPSATQLALIRRMIHMVFSPRAAGMKSSGLFSKKNLKDEWLQTWVKFYRESYYYQYLLDYGSTIKQVTDLSSLWFREFYLEVTGCIQFPISMSIPWVMTDYLIKQRNMKDNIFFLFDIYNDAAAKSLHTLKQQFLYDEIEAELNLAFEQLLYHLSKDVFTYYKSVAGSMLIDKQYKTKYQSVKNTDSLTVRLVRYKSIISQTRVSLLGRSLDVTALVAEHCNRLLKENILAAIRKFESQDFTSIVELSRLFKHIKLAHKLLSKLVTLDPLRQLFRECDESVGLCQYRSRIMAHAFTELVTDIFPRYIFNQTTQRFVRSPEFTPNEVNPDVVREGVPRGVETFMWFGKGFKNAYDRENALFKGFVGIEHCTALLEVMATGQEFMLAREVTEEFVSKFLTETIVYLETVQTALGSTKPPGLQYSVVAAYTLFEAKLKPISSWSQLRSGLFTKIRELGNGFAFLMLFEDAMQIKSHFTFQTETYFNGIRPIPPRDPAMPPLAEAHQQLFLREYDSPDKLPFVHHLTQSMTSLWNTAAQNDFLKMTHFNEDSLGSEPVSQTFEKNWFSPPFCHNKIHVDTGVVIQNIIDNAHACGYNLLLRATHNPPSITSAAVARIIQACNDAGLTKKLSAFGQLTQFLEDEEKLGNPPPAPRALDLEHGKDIARIVSALFFIFNQFNVNYNGPKWGVEVKATSAMLGDRALYGDSFILGLSTILHAFGERYRFELTDFTTCVGRIDLVSPCPREISDKRDKNNEKTPQQLSEERFIPEVLNFLSNSSISKDLLSYYLDILESYCPAPSPDIQPIDLSAASSSGLMTAGVGGTIPRTVSNIAEGSVTRTHSSLYSTTSNVPTAPSASTLRAPIAPSAPSALVPPQSLHVDTSAGGNSANYLQTPSMAYGQHDTPQGSSSAYHFDNEDEIELDQNASHSSMHFERMSFSQPSAPAAPIAPSAPMAPPQSSGGFHAPPPPTPSGGFHAPPPPTPSGGFHAPPPPTPSGGFHAPPPPTPSGGFHAPPPPTPSGGFHAPPPPTPSGGFHAPPPPQAPQYDGYNEW